MSGATLQTKPTISSRRLIISRSAQGWRSTCMTKFVRLACTPLTVSTHEKTPAAATMIMIRAQKTFRIVL